MTQDTTDWLSLTEASEMLGVHPTTLRRWADSGSVPCFRTPGGHRRFRAAGLATWLEGTGSTVLAPRPEALVRSAVGYTRQQMARNHVAVESWYAAFDREEERQQMRDTGRRLFGLALQYMSRSRNHEPVLREGRKIGEFYGQVCAQHSVSLADTARALVFFRDSLLRGASPDATYGDQQDAEDARIQQRVRHFLDEVMYACFDSYQATWLQPLSSGIVVP